MGKARITLSTDTFNFSCEGSAKWTGHQLSKIIDFLRSTSAGEETDEPRSDRLRVDVVEDDVMDHQCDYLVLKYAQSFFGADRAVAERLAIEASAINVDSFALEPGEYMLLDSNGSLRARHVLFCGVSPLGSFRYEDIRAFAEDSLRHIAKVTPKPATLAMTIHGVGYGLDEKSALVAQIQGLARAFAVPRVRRMIRHVAIVEKDHDRSVRLAHEVSGIRLSGTSLTGVSK